MFNPHRNRILGLAGVLAIAATGVAGAAALPGSVTVPLPGVPGQQALEVCVQDDGRAPTCKTISTPNITGGELKIGWDTETSGGVYATPVTLYPAQCNGKKGVALRAVATDYAVDVVIELKASYAGISTPRTESRTKRTIPIATGLTTWACLL